MKVMRAFRNMLAAAARDPAWALAAIPLNLFRGAKYIFGTILAAGIVLFVLSLVAGWIIGKLGFKEGSPVHIVLMLIAVAATAVFVLRRATAPMIRRFGDMGGDTHGTARFASTAEAGPLTQSPDGLLVGRDAKTAKLLRYSGGSHLMTIAPTRTGKGVGTLIPNLLTLSRSVICIDPKGENTRVTYKARARFGPVHILDPFGIGGQPSACFNPLAAFDPASLDLAEDAATLADALVFDAPGEAGEAHWNEEAKALIGGLILHIVTLEPPERRTLAVLRALLTCAPRDFETLLADMQASTAAGGLVARAANRHLGKADREATGVLSAAQRHTHFLDSPRMTAVLDRSDFAFADLKARTASVFLILPPDRLTTYARWLRLMVTQSLQDMARANVPASAPVLFLLDEFAALGHLAPVERAMTLMAGYGIQLWPILQDIHQLKATYGARAGTFLSNVAVLQMFGINDHETARLASDLLGQGTVVFETTSRALDSDRSGITYAEHHSGRPLLTPDEVRNLPQSRELLFVAGMRPVLADKLRYYADGEFRGLFSPG
jgi:type IV secretion system protein VirD4